MVFSRLEPDIMKPKGPPPSGPDLGNRDQVRRLRQAQERSAELVVRCQACGHQQFAEAAMIGPLSVCDKCGAALHSCRHCMHFDPSVRHQCRRGLKEPAGVSARNECASFEPRLVLDATGKRLHGKTATTAKSTFDSLFKK